MIYAAEFPKSNTLFNGPDRQKTNVPESPGVVMPLKKEVIPTIPAIIVFKVTPTSSIIMTGARAAVIADRYVWNSSHTTPTNDTQNAHINEGLRKETGTLIHRKPSGSGNYSMGTRCYICHR